MAEQDSISESSDLNLSPSINTSPMITSDSKSITLSSPDPIADPNYTSSDDLHSMTTNINTSVLEQDDDCFSSDDKRHLSSSFIDKTPLDSPLVTLETHDKTLDTSSISDSTSVFVIPRSITSASCNSLHFYQKGQVLESSSSVAGMESTNEEFSDSVMALCKEPTYDEFSKPRLRLDTLHMHGTNKMSSYDVANYFIAFSNVRIEWINDYCCNIKFDDAETAAQALFSIGYKPFQKKTEVANNEKSEEEYNNDIGDSGVSSSDSDDNFIVEDSNPWRIALPHFKNKNLLLRYATTSDRKEERPNKISKFYQRYGHIRSRSEVLLTEDAKRRRMKVKRRLESRINAVNLEVEKNLGGYIADLEIVEGTPSKYMKMYSEDLDGGWDFPVATNSPSSLLRSNKNSVDLRAKINAKKTRVYFSKII